MGQVHATQEQLTAMAQRCQDTGQSIATGMAQLVDRIQALGGGGMAGAANNALQGASVLSGCQAVPSAACAANFAASRLRAPM